VGVGTTMIIEIPRLAGEAPTAEDTGPEEDEPGTRGTLLVVDDEPDIGELIADLVRRRGYEAVYVDSAAAALAQVRPGEFLGTLPDLRMPTMDGAALWEALRQEQPVLARRTIFMTGDHAKPETAALLEGTGQPCLAKPFRSEELDEALTALQR